MTACKTGDIRIRLVDGLNVDFLVMVLWLYKILSLRETARRYTESLYYFLQCMCIYNYLKIKTSKEIRCPFLGKINISQSH